VGLGDRGEIAPRLAADLVRVRLVGDSAQLNRLQSLLKRIR